mmetsp:Transcript_23251/g.59757  ORF Transcript_23251/g.59757 Transcript_23251/m.59757 type:complete len:202 (+) Transcript_23251:125-730(+)
MRRWRPQQPRRDDDARRAERGQLAPRVDHALRTDTQQRGVRPTSTGAQSHGTIPTHTTVIVLCAGGARTTQRDVDDAHQHLDWVGLHGSAPTTDSATRRRQAAASSSTSSQGGRRRLQRTVPRLRERHTPPPTADCSLRRTLPYHDHHVRAACPVRRRNPNRPEKASHPNKSTPELLPKGISIKGPLIGPLLHPPGFVTIN